MKDNSLKTRREFPIQSLTTEFHINSLSNSLKYYNNLCQYDDKFIYKRFLFYLKNNNLLITEADKNIGLVILDKNVYNQLANDHLANQIIYKKIDDNPTLALNRKVVIMLDILFKNNHMHNKLFKFFDKTNSINNKIGTFRLLPKLHKQNFGIRPIINCKNSLLEPFSKLISILLKHIVVTQKTYIKDSQNLIQKTKNIQFKNNVFIHSAYFENLYTNIPTQKALIIISEFYMNSSIDGISSHCFNVILKLVLENNYFTFDSSFYLQIKGIPMGTSCGPDIANLFLAYFDIKNSLIFQPEFISRFIDDLFIINDKKLCNEDFLTLYPDLTLNITCEKTVNFLDLSISMNFNNSLLFNLFNKPTNTFSYIQPTSNHPDHIFNNIPLSLIKRAKKICSKDYDFHYHCNKIFINLLNRGYNPQYIIHLIRNVSKLERETLIPYKDIRSNFCKNSFPSILMFDKPFSNYFNFFHCLWKDLSIKYYSNYYKKTPNFKMSFSVLPNLQLMLVNNFSVNFKIFNYQKCTNSSCSICKFAYCSIYLVNKFNLPIQLMSYSTCTSTDCIYLITCKNCKMQCVGETNNLYNRFNNHISSINCFLKTGREPTKVASHFNSDCTLKDFSFQIFITNCINYRLRLEDDLQLILETKDPFGLNEFINKKIKSLDNYVKLF